jgi:hydrogenase maturation protease
VTALVVGVGQSDRGDDAAGLLVAEQVRRAEPDVEVVTVASPTRLLDLWDDRDDVVVVDAIRSGRCAGEVIAVDVTDRPLRAQSGAGGSHGFGVAEAVELSRSLGRLPQRLVVVGVEAETFAQGAGLSPAVAAAVPRATAAVLRALAATGRPARSH